jgi:C_GCAxxG_C_C family probable redox protein
MEHDGRREQVVELAREGFKSGLNCAEAVFDALRRAGVIEAPAQSIAMCMGFGGGIGLSGFTCGALSGAVMGLGARHGRRDPWATPAEERGRELTQKYYRRYNKLVCDFAASFGSVQCREINAKMEWAGKDRRRKCAQIVTAAAAMAYDNIMIAQDEAFRLPYQRAMGNPGN